jgi:hypothetical protein
VIALIDWPMQSTWAIRECAHSRVKAFCSLSGGHDDKFRRYAVYPVELGRAGP